MSDHRTDAERYIESIVATMTAEHEKLSDVVAHLIDIIETERPATKDFAFGEWEEIGEMVGHVSFGEFVANPED